MAKITLPCLFILWYTVGTQERKGGRPMDDRYPWLDAFLLARPGCTKDYKPE